MNHGDTPLHCIEPARLNRSSTKKSSIFYTPAHGKYMVHTFNPHESTCYTAASASKASPTETSIIITAEAPSFLHVVACAPSSTPFAPLTSHNCLKSSPYVLAVLPPALELSFRKPAMGKQLDYPLIQKNIRPQSDPSLVRKPKWAFMYLMAFGNKRR